MPGNAQNGATLADLGQGSGLAAVPYESASGGDFGGRLVLGKTTEREGSLLSVRTDGGRLAKVWLRSIGDPLVADFVTFDE